MAAPLKASKKFLARRPNDRLALRIKVGGVESAHDYILSAAIAQLSAKAIVDDLKRHGHHFSLERVLDIIRVHHPEEDNNNLYEGNKFAARFILEVVRNWNRHRRESQHPRRWRRLHHHTKGGNQDPKYKRTSHHSANAGRPREGRLEGRSPLPFHPQIFPRGNQQHLPTRALLGRQQNQKGV